MILAHREVDNEGNVLEQLLEEHLYKTGKRCGEIGKEVKLEAFMKLIGYLHDCGKAERLFQEYIRGEIKQRINHSSAGGRVLKDYIILNPKFAPLKKKINFRYFQEVICYVIFAHHGLYDQIEYGEAEHKEHLRMEYDQEGGYHYQEDVLTFVRSFDTTLQEKGELSFEELIEAAFEEFKVLYKELRELSNKNSDDERKKEEKEYYIACLTRLCLSILKEADIYDSANVFREPKQVLWQMDERYEVWLESFKRIEHMYQEYESIPNPSEINAARNILAKRVKEAALANDTGIFKLELPTGAGKTKGGLRYALTNAVKYNRSGVLYITAYLSVLEQNAAQIRDIIGNDKAVLEHHSNMIEEVDKESFESDEDKAEYESKAYIKESWESPIILTTMVQFFNTLFKERAANIRRFCKLINSVIIIDEVQSLPLKVLSNFNLMMNFMKVIMHCNIVHCTATQPLLDNERMRYKLYYGNLFDTEDTIVSVNENKMKCFQRVDFYNLTGENATNTLSTEELYSLVREQLEVFDSCLIVLNTRAAVAEFYAFLEDNLQDAEIVYLTTNLCAAHRLEVISDIKTKLQKNRSQKEGCYKIVCVSTNLIEAGVDLDFDVVFRSLAGIDSLIQCAGRCNREGKLMRDGIYIHGKFYIVRYNRENLKNLEDIKAASDASEQAIRLQKAEKSEKKYGLNINLLKNPYYNKYYVENSNKLDYVDMNSRSTMVEELGRNCQGQNAYYYMGKEGRLSGQGPLMFQAFRRAAENFELIEQRAVGVIVVYKNEELLEQLEQAILMRDYVVIKQKLRQLQRYTVNIQISSKMEPYITKNEEFNIYFLQKEYYNGKQGIMIDHLADLIL